MEYTDRYLAFTGQAPRRVPHMEHWSCPDAETYLTGIDYYDHPRLCRERLRDLYPQIGLGIPEKDAPVPRPEMDLDGKSSDPDRHTVRWGAGESGTWAHGEAFFHSPEEVFAFSPIEFSEQSDWSERNVVVSGDFSSEEAAYQTFRKKYPRDADDTAPEDSEAMCGFYNTMFMWPLLTFGWELFLECCLDPRFEPIMEEFAEINRRVFKAFARLPVNFVMCHDDIVNTRGPVCSPAWMHKYIFPRYEEFWGYCRDGGKTVFFMSDGNMDAYADDVIACGARGIVSEPYTDYKAIARKHPEMNLMLAGEGDNRILTRNDPDEIDAMVRSMVETAKMTGGYFMCIGNHIPWNVTPEGIKRYLDRSAEWAWRK
jgi:hypothetical protein